MLQNTYHIKAVAYYTNNIYRNEAVIICTAPTTQYETVQYQIYDA